MKLLFLMILLTGSLLHGQEKQKLFGKSIDTYSKNPENGIIRCASTEYEQYLENKDGTRPSKKEFEDWLSPKVDKMKRALRSVKTTDELFVIPVVVHVIHTGVPVGSGPNISDQRVESQITVLNQDYQKMFGTLGYNTNPVGANVGIEFRLAQTDPYGHATNGIDRVVKTGYVWNTNNIETILKPQTQWDPNQYFNIWVCEFGGDLVTPNQILGYAQFPVSSGLPGLAIPPYTANTDGVILDWKAFGSSTYAGGTYFTNYDKGRTLTHEMGHALGLRHIWGDNSSCTVDATDSFKDYCLDTPAAARENYVCNITPPADSCPSDPGNDMIENYMDYTNDTCMNIFTQDQKARILTVLQNSPRRASLTMSNTWMTPEEMGMLTQVSLYPNPITGDMLTVVFKNPEVQITNYKIFDSVGVLLREQNISQKGGFQVNVAGWGSEVYNMVVSTSIGTKKLRFSIIR